MGLARLSEGLELVRVGAPMRDEFAAWRYGDQFGRRRQRAIAYTAASAATFGVVVVGGAAARISIGMVPGVMSAVRRWFRDRTIDRLWDPDGHRIRVQRKHLFTSRLATAEDGLGWEIHVDHVYGWEKASRRAGRRRLEPVEGSGWRLRDAARAFAGSDKVHLPEKKLARLSKPIPGSLAGLSDDVRLAVEMATQEQAEREALEGELKGLEAMWRQAEEIAHIADNLLMPESVDAFIREERARGADDDPPAGPGPAAGGRQRSTRASRAAS